LKNFIEFALICMKSKVCCVRLAFC